MRQLFFLHKLLRLKRHVYLDHNATTYVSRRVRQTMQRVLSTSYGNPSSLYNIGRKSAEIIETSRQYVADAIGANASEVFFTGCATESNNAVLQSLARQFYPRKKKIISTPVEHSSVLNTLEFLKKQGITIQYCPVDRYGRVLPDELKKLIDDDTFLFCCMLANNEIGTIQDIETISMIAKQNSVLVLSDCVQALGKIPVNVHAMGVDYASFSAHKLHGPKGVGAIYVKEGSPFTPLIHGGHQENGMRAGTESIHNIAGFGEACKGVAKLLAHSEQIARKKQYLIDHLKKIEPQCRIISPDTGSLPNTLSCRFPGMENAALTAALDHNGIAVSTGSACTTHDYKPSRTLVAIGLSEKATRETIRISLDKTTSYKDIRYTLHVIQRFLKNSDSTIKIVPPTRIDEKFLYSNQTCVVDVRPQFLRKKTKGFPNSHVVSFFSIQHYLHQFPKDRDILLFCQHGNLSYAAAWYLKSKGFHKISSLQGGIIGWKIRHHELYKKLLENNMPRVTNETRGNI